MTKTETSVCEHYGLRQSNADARTARKHYEDFKRSTKLSLYDCYGVPSYAKENAYKNCLQFMQHLEGFRFKIISYNIMQFTCGFEFCDSETGALMFCYITKDYIRICEISKNFERKGLTNKTE